MLEECAVCQKALAWWPYIAAIAVSVVNGLLNYYTDSKGVRKVLNVILDILSVVPRKNSPGSVKFPLTKSKAAIK